MKPDRLTNFTYISERDELPWLRPEDFKDIELTSANGIDQWCI